LGTRNLREYARKVPATIQVFDKFYRRYDAWFRRNKWVYTSEIEALGGLIPRDGLGLEVGVGSGRFSTPFEVKVGLDPSTKMASMAKKRGINVICGVGELLPFKEETFDFVLNVTTICFIRNPWKALEETRRVLRKRGAAIIGFIDRNSQLGKSYEAKKTVNMFYGLARFYSVDDIKKMLVGLSFVDFSVCQTLFRDINQINALEPVKEGHGEGGFVVLGAIKGE